MKRREGLFSWFRQWCAKPFLRDREWRAFSRGYWSRDLHDFVEQPQTQKVAHASIPPSQRIPTGQLSLIGQATRKAIEECPTAPASGELARRVDRYLHDYERALAAIPPAYPAEQPPIKRNPLALGAAAWLIDPMPEESWLNSGTAVVPPDPLQELEVLSRNSQLLPPLDDHDPEGDTEQKPAVKAIVQLRMARRWVGQRTRYNLPEGEQRKEE